MYKFDREAYDRRMEWYRDARFGMFIHWDFMPSRHAENGCGVPSRFQKKIT